MIAFDELKSFRNNRRKSIVPIVGIGTTAPSGKLEISETTGGFDVDGASIMFSPIQSGAYTAPKAKITVKSGVGVLGGNR